MRALLRQPHLAARGAAPAGGRAARRDHSQPRPAGARHLGGRASGTLGDARGDRERGRAPLRPARHRRHRRRAHRRVPRPQRFQRRDWVRALDVPIPCAATPKANPRCHQARTLTALRMKRPSTAPSTPVVTANTAVSVGEAWRRSAIPMAMGAVTDLAYIPCTREWSAPIKVRTPTATPIEVIPPANMAITSGAIRPLSDDQPLKMGMASETVAVPSKKWTNWAPSKYC